MDSGFENVSTVSTEGKSSTTRLGRSKIKEPDLLFSCGIKAIGKPTGKTIGKTTWKIGILAVDQWIAGFLLQIFFFLHRFPQ